MGDVATTRIHRTVENIQYFYECSDRADERRNAANTLPPELETGLGLADATEQEAGPMPTEAEITLARENRYAAREVLFGQNAVQIAVGNGIFSVEYESTMSLPHARRATEEEMATYAQWGVRIARFTRSANYTMHNNMNIAAPDEGGVVSGADAQPRVDPGGVVDITPPDAAPESPRPPSLNAEQQRAHDIVIQHLLATQRNERPRQLLMLIRGEGGTGKTVLLNAISQSFQHHSASEWLAKTATTGVAASLFGGQTLHSWAGIPILKRAGNSGGTTTSAAHRRVSEKRKQNIIPTRYLLIDECSMLTQRVLESLSQILGTVKSEAGQCLASDAFGNINVILIGDFHQFPPVGSLRQALFADDDTPDFIPSIGLSLYHQFTTVVTLTEQRRVTDARWMELLRRLRTGSCTEADVAIVKKLVVGNPDYEAPSWTPRAWDSVVLVTPRHGARVLWNAESLRKHRARTGHPVYTCCAHDVVTGSDRDLTLRERLLVTLLPTKQSGKLDERVEISIGMRAMVLFNISTEADLANGTRGEVVDIILDSREPLPLQTDVRSGNTLLRFPPAVVLFKPDISNFPSFEGLPAGVIPIVPSVAKFSIHIGTQRTQITRRQFAMTPGYAFTDYKSQGQTIEYVLIDLGNPPTGCLTPFSAYVALSRSHGRDNIRILRGFDQRLFTSHPSELLRHEDLRLDGLTRATMLRHPVLATSTST